MARTKGSTNKVTKEHVAANVQKHARRVAAELHDQVYKNKHGVPAADILAALGAKAAHFTTALDALTVVATPVAPPVVAAGSGQ